MTSIRDVAREAGVAISTVSKVLNHYPNVSPETRNRVEEAVRKLQDTLMGIPEPFERLDGLLEHPWEAWAQEVREAVRLDLTEAEELAERERALLADPLLPQAAHASLRNTTLEDVFVERIGRRLTVR